jgi:hypothetical protein
MSELNQLLNKLHKTYRETGGKGLDPPELDPTLCSFDASLILISGKIEATRASLAKREEKKLVASAKLKLNQSIRNMIQFIISDRKKMEKLYDENFKKGSDENELKKQKMDLELIDKHIKDLQSKDSERYESIGSTTTTVGTKPSISLSDIQDQEVLPSIDISKSLSKVKSFQERVDLQVNVFSNKLDKLREVIMSTGDELDQQKILMDGVDLKVNSETTSLISINSRVEQSHVQTNTSTRLCVLFILIVILLFCGSIVFLYLSMMLRK